MATNLHENLEKGGASLHVHNRTESKAKSLIDKGATWESSPAEIAQKCRITFSSMFADEGLKSTFRAWLSGKPQKGSIYVDSSTVYPGTAKELTAEAEKAGMALAYMLQTLKNKRTKTHVQQCCQLAYAKHSAHRQQCSHHVSLQLSAYATEQWHLLSCSMPLLPISLSNIPLKSLEKQYKGLVDLLFQKYEGQHMSNTCSMLLHGVQVCTMYPRLSLADLTLPGSTECCLLWLVQRKPSNSCRHTSNGWVGALWYALISLHAYIVAADSRNCLNY